MLCARGFLPTTMSDSAEDPPTDSKLLHWQAQDVGEQPKRIVFEPAIVPLRNQGDIPPSAESHHPQVARKAHRRGAV